VACRGMKAKQAHSPVAVQDIAHTFPGHPWIQSPDGQAALKRVLSAYSVHNDKVGYCRAMNNIVGLLLVAMNRCAEGRGPRCHMGPWMEPAQPRQS
jgi:hypothetical protein